VKLDTSYSLSKVGDLNSYYNPKAGTVYLPGPGHYLIYAEGPALDTVFDLRDTGLYIFRFREPDHGLYNTGALDTPPLYSKCDSLLNGYQEYHYPDGTLEMRGTFKGGFEKDSIVKFFKNGVVKSRVLFLPKVIIGESFDSLGNRMSIKHTERKSFMVYREYDLKLFYPDGKIKKIETSKKMLVKIKEYYPDGTLKIIQTKHYRTEYYNSGIKSITYKWSAETDHIVKTKDFTVHKTEYDTTGQVTRKTVYEDGNSHYPLPEFDYRRSDWIVSVQKFEKGKVVFSEEYMDTEEYLKKYPDQDVGNE